MVKKILKIVGIVLVMFLLSLFTIPYFFKDQIKAKIEATLNENFDAKISFANADLSLFKDFPNANITLNKLVIINKAPFEGDTLVSLGEMNLKMSLKELFKGKEEPITIHGFSTKDGLINIIFNKEGIGNFDIALKDKDEKDPSQSDPMLLKIDSYSFKNYRFQFTDETSKLKMTIDSLNHEGKGDFVASKLDLDTKTTARISLMMDKVHYLNKVKIALNAILGVDLNKKEYVFKENKAKINELPLEFNGSLQLLEGGQNYNLQFKTPTSSFKNFLGILPSTYSSDLDQVKTTGDFTVVGFAKGIYSKTTVPKFNIAIASNNASFQFPNLPKSVKNIVIQTQIINDTGILNDTYVHLDQLSFAIDQDVFNAKATIKNMISNALVDATMKGTINLGNLSQAYPIKLKIPLSGILKADVNSQFDMKSVEDKLYQNIKNSGLISLTSFKFADSNGKVMNINNALVQFNPNHVDLQQFNATTGKSDLNVTGTLDNFYGFLFRNQELQGNFNLASKQIVINDFMTSNQSDKEATNNEKNKGMKIPAFLNCSLSAKANTVIYDNLNLKEVSGKLIIKDEKVTLQNVKTSIFGGTIGANGAVSTKGKIPIFNMNLGLNQVDIQQSFTQLDMLKNIAPIAGIIEGKLNSTIQLEGNLNPKSLTPDLKTLSGDLMGQLASTSINPNNSTLLRALGSNLKFVDLKKLNLNDVKASLTFQNGKVMVKPFDLKYQDIKATVGGTHGFDQTMNYNIKLDVPAKYLGNEANSLIAKLTPNDMAKLGNLPINVLLSGSFTNPKISTDMKNAVSTLATRLVNKQKDKLIQQGASALGNLLGGNKNSTDTTKTKTPINKEELKNKAKDLLNGLFNKK